MILSMTGFGKGEASLDSFEVQAEIKSVNHRFLDISCKIPSYLNSVESELTALVKEKLKRGRVEIFLSISNESSDFAEFDLDEVLFNNLFAVYQKALSSVSSISKQSKIDSVFQILKRKDVLTKKKSELPEELSGAVLQAVSLAAEDLMSMREKEGAQLEKELLSQLEHCANLIEKIKINSKSTKDIIRQKLDERLAEVDVSVDKDRLAQEVALLAERADVTEELIRLDSHISQFEDILVKNEGGRKLEFLLQEFLREINTIGSKSHSSDISKLVVDCKSILEKLREQVANVE